MVKRSTFRNRLFRVFLIASVLPLFLSLVFTVHLFKMKVDEDGEKGAQKKTEDIAKELNLFFDNTEGVFRSLGRNPVMQEALHGRGDEKDIYSALYAGTASLQTLGRIDVCQGEKVLFSVGEKIPEDRTMSWISKNENKPFSGRARTGGKGMLLTYKIAGTEGLFTMTIDSAGFERILKNYDSPSEGILILNRYFEPIWGGGILSPHGRIHKVRKNIFEGRKVSAGFEENLYGTVIGFENIHVIYAVKPPLSDNTVKSMGNIIVILTGVSLVIGFLFARSVSETLSKPACELERGMREVAEGNLDTEIVLEGPEEFVRLADGYNKMNRDLKIQMDLSAQAERCLSEARIGMMQAQLNPHFLYNTLDTIKWLAKIHGAEEISQMSVDLARILRYAISADNKVMLLEEIERVRDYCAIQQVRFGNNFDISIDLPEKLKTCEIPKLVIQPLVENALQHGLKECSKGLIQVRIYKVQQSVVAEVKDSGEGISKEVCEAVKKGDWEAMTGHLGLMNVDTIFKMEYGQMYGVTAERLEKGSRVSLVWPCKRWEETC